jgi:hypothetical protein
MQGNQWQDDWWVDVKEGSVVGLQFKGTAAPKNLKHSLCDQKMDFTSDGISWVGDAGFRALFEVHRQ